MNDRFKFRVWLKHSEKMIYIDKKEGDNLYSFLENVNDRQIIMQCTGLKDKNGKLIYEGDIVQIFHVSSTMQGKLFKDIVCYNEKRARFETENYGVFNEDDDYEVLGNIYENKELLNENS